MKKKGSIPDAESVLLVVPLGVASQPQNGLLRKPNEVEVATEMSILARGSDMEVNEPLARPDRNHVSPQ